MRRVNPKIARRAALLSTLCAFGCSTHPASSRGAPDRPRAATATEWTGDRAVLGPPADAPISAPKGTWVLHIGDSFVHAFLWQNLRPRFRSVGTEYVVDAATATYTTTWASDPELDNWLSKRPALVLVTLGANEVDIPAPDQHARAVAALARRIAAVGASCVWIAPPLWKEETGILGVIHDHCAPCLFFDSDAVLGGLSAAERKRDRIHPNERGGGRWAAALWGWLTDHRDPSRGPWALAPFERRGS
jgi:hypothetical protein